MTMESEDDIIARMHGGPEATSPTTPPPTADTHQTHVPGGCPFPCAEPCTGRVSLVTPGQLDPARCGDGTGSAT